MSPDYRVYTPDERGDLKDITFSQENSVPLELLLAANVGKTIALYLAKALEKEWVWNESYPKKIVTMIAELVGEAMKTE